MSTSRSKVFEETYKKYLKEIQTINYLLKAASMGVEVESNSLRIPLYDKYYLFNEQGLTSLEGDTITPAVQVMVCKYILTCPEQLPDLDNTLVTYRDFKDTGPLISYFTNNTNKTLEQSFAHDMKRLQARIINLGGEIVPSETYDLSAKLYAFPRVPVILNFNDKDEMFPPACSLLYQRSAATFLDMECLAMTGTLLTGKLLE